MLQIGSYSIDRKVILAPMSGVSDYPFRKLCSKLGSGLAYSEMVSAKTELFGKRKSVLRLLAHQTDLPHIIQILGTEPKQMSEVARLAVDFGAQVIDINMGCPAKKVCNVQAGSALMKNVGLVEDILKSVTQAVAVPVTLKIRTGWDSSQRNAVEIAKLAENLGVKAIAIHGRTRSCGFSGHAEYDTIKQVKMAVGIPVIANGDIDSPDKAEYVLDYTKADAVMVGRAALGNPWILRQIDDRIESVKTCTQMTWAEKKQSILEHLTDIYSFYGHQAGVRIARKHIGWYFKSQKLDSNFSLTGIYSIEDADEQLKALSNALDSVN